MPNKEGNNIRRRATDNAVLPNTCRWE